MSTLSRAMAVYLVFCLFVVMFKPVHVYDVKGDMRKFGFQPNETLGTFPIVTTFVGLMAYFSFTLAEVHDIKL